MNKICPVCNNYAAPRLKKGNVEYCQCSSCGTLFSEPLNNENMVGGGNEVPRNELQNHIRIARIDELTAKMKREDVNILDFGCGSGMLLNDLRKTGYKCDGYDAYSNEFNRFPQKNKYDIVTLIEVAEHLSSPFVEFDVICRSLMVNGVLMIESSFTDVAQEEGIELEDFFYIAPEVGHSTIFSHWGLDLLMALKGFKPIQHWNRHVRGYQKLFK